MKKRLIIITTILLLIITGCQERPDQNGGQLETNHSSIFDMAPIEYCRITNDNTEVKSGFGNKFENIGTLNQDDVVKVLDHMGDWYAIQLDDNLVGAIPTNMATPIVREDHIASTSPDKETPSPDMDQEIVEIPADDQPEPDQPTPQAQADEYTPRIAPPEDQLTPARQAPEAPDDPAPVPARPVPDAPDEEPDREQPRAEGPIRELTDQERQMVDLVNEARQQNDLQPLEVDLEVTRVARIKSQDMVDHNYFSHYSPTYGSPFEMLDAFAISYLHAGENLAGNNNVQNAHTSLMNSSGHRKNILNPNFTHIGIGVKSSPRYGYVYTQLFISKPR